MDLETDISHNKMEQSRWAQYPSAEEEEEEKVGGLKVQGHPVRPVLATRDPVLNHQYGAGGIVQLIKALAFEVHGPESNTQTPWTKPRLGGGVTL